MKTFKLNLDRTHYTVKAEINTADVQNNLKYNQVEITLEELATELSKGATMTPALLSSAGADNWLQQQIFALDLDNEKDKVRVSNDMYITYQEAIAVAQSHNIEPAFVYTTFSHKDSHHKFRMVFVLDEVIRDAEVRDSIQLRLMGMYQAVDSRTADRGRLFYGTNTKPVYENYEARFTTEAIMNLPEYKKTSSKATVSKARLSDEETKTYFLDQLDLLKEEVTEDFITYKDFYQFVRSLPIDEYFNLTAGKSFRCILHDDNKPSATIYEEDGIQLYKCFVCSDRLNTVQLVEALFDLQTRDALDLIADKLNITLLDGYQGQMKQLTDDNRFWLNHSKSFQRSKAYKDRQVKSLLPVLHEMLNIAPTLAKEPVEGTKPVFFISGYDLTARLKANGTKGADIKNVQDKLILLCQYGLLERVDFTELSQEQYKQAKAITDANGYRNMTCYYTFPTYDKTTTKVMVDFMTTKKATRSLKAGLSKAQVARAQGEKKAKEIYNQSKATTEIQDNGFIQMTSAAYTLLEEHNYFTLEMLAEVLGVKTNDKQLLKRLPSLVKEEGMKVDFTNKKNREILGINPDLSFNKKIYFMI